MDEILVEEGEHLLRFKDDSVVLTRYPEKFIVKDSMTILGDPNARLYPGPNGMLLKIGKRKWVKLIDKSYPH